MYPAETFQDNAMHAVQQAGERQAAMTYDLLAIAASIEHLANVLEDQRRRQREGGASSPKQHGTPGSPSRICAVRKAEA